MADFSNGYITSYRILSGVPPFFFSLGPWSVGLVQNTFRTTISQWKALTTIGLQHKPLAVHSING